jgi:hypothetical protein
VAIDKYHIAVGKLAPKQGVTVAQFREQAPKGILLRQGVDSPVFGVGQQLSGWDAA